MISFPNCKINLGLHVTARRDDGYHDIETVFYPVGWCDALEIALDTGGSAGFTLQASGDLITGDSPDDNIVSKAWVLLSKRHRLPPLKAHLHKHIPMGAGLGGGSSDGAHALRMISGLCALGYHDGELAELAAQLGSDCPFFIFNRPMLARGRGEILEDLDVPLHGYHFLLVYPGIHVSTAEAYRLVKPASPPLPLADVVRKPVHEWRSLLRNDFEAGVFALHPALQKLKTAMYEGGAVYAAMSGSGSTVFGIFRDAPPPALMKLRHFHQEPRLNIL